MANQTITVDTPLEAILTGTSFLNGENITINNGAVVTMTRSNSKLIGQIDINDGMFFIDGINISSGNCINFIGESTEEINVNGNGIFSAVGGWYTLGTTNGTPAQVISTSAYFSGGSQFSPLSGDVLAGIWIETGRKIDYSGGTGLLPAVDDWVYKNLDTNQVGRIVDVTGDTTSGSLYVKYFLGSLAGGDGITVRKVVDNYGPDLQRTWSATCTVADVKADGIFQEYVNTRQNGTFRMTDFSSYHNGFIFDHASASTTLTLPGGVGYSGFQPPSGCLIKVPNINFGTSTIALYTGTTPGRISVPAANTDRYNLVCTLGGEVYMSACNISTAFFQTSNASVFDNRYVASTIGIGNSASPSKNIIKNCIVCDDVHLATLPVNTNVFNITDCFAGSEIEDSIVVRQAATAKHLLGAETSTDVTYKNCIASLGTALGVAVNPYYGVTSSNLIIDNCILYGVGHTTTSAPCLSLTTCKNVEISDIKMSATSKRIQQVPEIDMTNFAAGCDNISMVGIEILPEGIMGNYFATITDCYNMKFRCMGMIDEKVDWNMGPLADDAEQVFNIAGFSTDIDIARIWRTGAGAGANFIITLATQKNLSIKNCSSNYASAFSPLAGDTFTIQGLHAASNTIGNAAGIQTVYNSVYGYNCYDGFKSDVSGYCGCIFITPSDTTSPLVTVTNGNPKFFKDGTLDFAAGDAIEFESYYFMKGHSGFTGKYTAALGAASNYADEFSNVTPYIQYMTGTTWNGSWLEVRTPSNLTSIEIPTSGIKLKYRFVNTGATTIADLSMLILETLTSIDYQKANFYPIDQEEYTLTLSPLIAGTEVRIYRASDMVEIAGVESSTTSFEYTYTYTGNVPVIIVIHNETYEYISLNYTLSNSNSSIPIQQRIDRNYVNN